MRIERVGNGSLLYREGMAPNFSLCFRHWKLDWNIVDRLTRLNGAPPMPSKIGQQGECRLRDLKNDELGQKLNELREEKARLTEAFVSGRIPQDVYKKTVIRLEKEISNIAAEIRRRATKK